jgi:hypothetical protein
MEEETLDGFTVVDSPLPYAANGRYVSEEYLTEQIDSLWANRQAYSSAIKAQQTEMRGFEKTMGEMLFTMKVILSRPGRGGGWSSWLKQRGIPRASADRMVQRYATGLPTHDQSPHESISEPTDELILKLFTRLWPRIQKTLTTNASIFRFLGCIATASGIAHDWREDGLFIFHPDVRASWIPEPVTQLDSSQSCELTYDGDVL